MLTTKELQDYKEAHEKCPYGRDAFVGEKRCVNCIFYHFDNDSCSGTAESVTRHRIRLSLEY